MRLSFQKTSAFVAELAKPDVMLRVRVGQEFSIGGRHYRFSPVENAIRRADRDQMSVFRRLATSVSDFFANRLFDGSGESLGARLSGTRSARLSAHVEVQSARFRTGDSQRADSWMIGRPETGFARLVRDMAPLVDGRTLAELDSMGCPVPELHWQNLVDAGIKVAGESVQSLIKAGVNLQGVSLLTLRQHGVVVAGTPFLTMKRAGMNFLNASRDKLAKFGISIADVPAFELLDAGVVLHGLKPHEIGPLHDVKFARLAAEGLEMEGLSVETLIEKGADMSGVSRGALAEQRVMTAGVPFFKLRKARINMFGMSLTDIGSVDRVPRFRLTEAGISLKDQSFNDLVKAGVNMSGELLAWLKDVDLRNVPLGTLLERGVKVHHHTLEYLEKAGVSLEGCSWEQLGKAEVKLPQKVDFSWVVAKKVTGVPFDSLSGADHVPHEQLVNAGVVFKPDLSLR